MPLNLPPRPEGLAYGSRMWPPSKPPSTSVFMPPMRSHSSPSSGFTFQLAIVAFTLSTLEKSKMRIR
jgi:hypothetical protein